MPERIPEKTPLPTAVIKKVFFSGPDEDLPPIANGDTVGDLYRELLEGVEALFQVHDDPRWWKATARIVVFRAKAAEVLEALGMDDDDAETAT